MELFHLPLREIRSRFTRSELFMLAWRSQEQHYHFKRKMPKRDETYDDTLDVAKTKSGKKRKVYRDGIGPEVMPDEFFDDKGDFNLSKVPGEHARRYFEQVLRIPMPPGASRITNTPPEMQAAYGRRR